jgi:glucan phosphoethanolaminetransferase (alkaline phosphatase superfamily)
MSAETDENADSAEKGPLSTLLAALAWWLLVVLCAAGFLVLLSISTMGARTVISTRVIAAALVLIGLIVRCYFTIIEHTLTNWGKEAWQSQALNSEGLWSSMGSLLGLALLSWAPVFLVAHSMGASSEWLELACQITAALGCEYFCMGVLALVVFDNFTQIFPQHIIPALFKSGPAFMLAGAGLVLVPLAFETVWNVLPATQTVFVRALIASAVAAYFLIAHARLIGLLYVANRERIGWET